MPNKFSIAMCTYNGARHLREQLDSIVAQTRPPDELVICDDGSTDSTLEIISDFAANAAFPVNLHTNQRNQGSTKNFERAISFCTGDYIALSDQDDIWLPAKLAQLEAVFDGAPNVGLVFTDAEVVDDETRPTGYTLWQILPVTTRELRRLRAPYAIDELLKGATVTGATMAFRATYKELVLPIPDTLAIIHDAWITLLIASVSQVLALGTPLIRYRQHGGQQIGVRKRKIPQSGIKSAIQRKNSYQEMIDIGEKVVERLLEHNEGYRSEDARSRLETRLKHLRVRAHLPAEKLSRARCVIGELLSRRYHLYSKGFRSALKDLFA